MIKSIKRNIIGENSAIYLINDKVVFLFFMYHNRYAHICVLNDNPSFKSIELRMDNIFATNIKAKYHFEVLANHALENSFLDTSYHVYSLIDYFGAENIDIIDLGYQTYLRGIKLDKFLNNE